MKDEGNGMAIQYMYLCLASGLTISVRKLSYTNF